MLKKEYMDRFGFLVHFGLEFHQFDFRSLQMWTKVADGWIKGRLWKDDEG